MQRHDLDGFDVDWEYPGLPGLGNTHRPEDKENFTALMAELRAALNGLGREKHRTYLLTFAAGAFSDFITHTELDKLQASVDFVNLMTYDFRVAEADPVSGHHANLFPSAADAEQRSVDRAVKEFLAAGVPPGKLVVGVSFYGRGWAEVAADRNGRYQRGKPIEPRMDLNYGHLADIVGRDGFERFWDAESQGRTCGTPAAESSSPTKTRNRSAARAATSSSTASRGLCSGGTTRIRRGRCSMRSTRRSARLAACSH